MTSIFEATGNDILNTLNEEKQEKKEEIDFKRLYINLKDGENCTVRFLGPEHVKQYRSHGNFSLKLFNQTCTKKLGKCAYCQAHKYAKDNGIAEWDEIYAKNRFLFAMHDLSQKDTRIFNASKGQAKTIYNVIQEYKDDLHMAFKLSRTGEKVETTYTLNPILRLKDAKLEQALEESNQLELEPEIFDRALIVRSYPGQVKQLKELGFPAPDIFQVEQEKENNVLTEEMVNEQLPF